MNYNLYVKTIAPRKSHVNPKTLDSISSKTGLGSMHVVQRFIGEGFASLVHSSDKERVEDMKNGLEAIDIKSFIIDEDEKKRMHSIIAEAVSLKEYEDGISFKTNRGSIKLQKQDNVLVIAGINEKKARNNTFKSLFLDRNVLIYLYFSNQSTIVKLPVKKMDLSSVRGADRFSKTVNVKKLLDNIRESAVSYNEDFNYSLNYIPGISNSIDDYAATASMLFSDGFYSYQYPSGIFTEETEDESEAFSYDYHYDVYPPHKRFFKKKLVSVNSMRLIVLTPLIVNIAVLFLIDDILTPRIAGIAGIVITLYYLFFFFKYLKFRMFIEEIPTSSIESVSIGLRELKGSIMDRNAIPAFVSGMKCVYFRFYKYKYEKHYEKGREKTGWRLQRIGEYIPDRFYIEDNGFAMEVETRKAVLDIRNRTKYSSPHFLVNAAVRNKDVYYIEESLPVYSNVYIMGTVTDRDSRKAFADFLKKRKYDREYMKQFDANNDGEIDMSEWEHAKSQIESEYSEIRLNKKQNELLKIGYHEDDGLLFISDRSEKGIIRNINIYLILIILSLCVSVFTIIRGFVL
ncbi:MAG: hypothetical protein R6U31_07720 [bacterium]